jgi:hypothetical protein
MNTRKEEFVFLVVVAVILGGFWRDPYLTGALLLLGAAIYGLYKAAPWLRAHFNAFTFWLADLPDWFARRKHRREKRRLGYAVTEPSELKRLALGALGIHPRRSLLRFLLLLIPAAVLAVVVLVWFLIAWLDEPKD